MGRAPCCDKMGVKKGPWTLDEDQILVSYINKHGHGNWRALPKQAGLLRCGKSCRLRWTNYLRPDIKRGNFSPEEEDHIIKLHQLIGNRWSTIASHLPGRTDNEIKNVWNTHLKKRLARMKDESVALAAAPSSSLDSSTVEMTDHGSSPSTQILCNSDARAPSAWEEICTDPVYVLPELSEDVISSSYNMSSSAIDYPSTSTDSTLDVIQSDCIDSLELEIDHNRLPFDTFDEPESQPLSRDLQNIFDQNNFEDPAAGMAAISHDDNAEMVNSSSSQGMKGDGETLIINDESLNGSMNLQVDSPMQQFYGADLDWPFLDNMSPAMDSTHSATNSNQIWSTDFQAGEEMDYWLNILRQIEPLPLFHLAPPSQVSSPIFTSVEH